MRYQSTTGLCEETIDEITCRIADVIEGQGVGKVGLGGCLGE